MIVVGYVSALVTGWVASLACAAVAVLAIVDYTQVWVGLIAATASVINTFMLTRVRREHRIIQREVADTKAKVGADRRASEQES